MRSLTCKLETNTKIYLNNSNGKARKGFFQKGPEKTKCLSLD
jgi:hypothetical protein